MRSLLLLAGLPLLGQYLPPQVLARVQIRGIDESSGIAPSRRYKGSYWTHNDSGSRLDLYLVSRKGTLADASWTLARRASRGARIWEPPREHL